MDASVPSGATILVAPRRKLIRLSAIACVFTAGGVLMIASGEAAGWFVSIFFGLCLLIFIAMLLRPSRLTIDDVGMTSVHLWRRDRYEFVDCSGFTTWRNPFAPSQQLVVFDWTRARRTRLARLGRGFAGRNSSLPETYGMSASDLAHLLNERSDEGRMTSKTR